MKKIIALSASVLIGISLVSFIPKVEKILNLKEIQTQESPRKEALGTVNGVSVKIDYGSPSVKGRTIWGGLEQYGAVWRAGANETTSIEYDKDVIINGKLLPAGKYAFFIIPNKDNEWVIIFNEEWSKDKHGAWGAYSYHKEKDVLRILVKPIWVKEVQEQLKYEVKGKGIKIAWGKARIELGVKVQ